MNGPSRNKGQSRMDHLETKGNHEWTIQKQRAIKNGPPRNKGQSRMDHLETKGTMGTQNKG